LTTALVETAQQVHAGVPTTFPEFLRSRADKGKEVAEQQRTQVNQYTDPAAVVEEAKRAAVSAIGRELTADEAQRFATYFHAKEAAYNLERNTANAGTEPVVDMMQPDLGSEAGQYVDTHFVHEVGAQRGQEYIHALLGMVGAQGA
jgi:hypothetical protein